MIDRRVTGLASLLHGSLTPATQDPQFTGRRAAIKTHLSNIHAQLKVIQDTIDIEWAPPSPKAVATQSSTTPARSLKRPSDGIYAPDKERFQRRKESSRTPQTEALELNWLRDPDVLSHKCPFVLHRRHRRHML
jgi:hypothetical protein